MWKASAALTHNVACLHKSMCNNWLSLVCLPSFHTLSTMAPAGPPGAVRDGFCMGAGAPINAHDGNEL